MAFHGFIQSPERQPTTGQRLAQSIGQIAPGVAKSLGEHVTTQRKERAENDALKRLTGQDFTGMSPDIKKEFVKVFTGARSQKEQEKHQMLQTGLGTIEQMRSLLEHAGPSNWLGGLFPGETQKARAELSQLGKSLIPLVSAGVSIRNQKEFDEYKKVISDPNSQQSKIEGALNGLENLLSRQLQGGEKDEEEKEKIPKETSSSMVKVKTPDGKIKMIPKKHIRAAMNAGGKVIR